MKSTSSGAPSPTSTSFSGISNYRTESYRPLRAKNVPHVPSIDYRIVSETHFNEFDRYLAAYLAKAAPNSRSTARQKLTRLTIEQFSELSTDVYDELVRRENEKEVPFLPVREEFHPKRNQARQKLATLPVTRFEDLCSDVHWELIRRYPEFKEAPSELQANEDTMGASEELQGEEGSKLLRRRPRLPLQHELSMAPLTFARGEGEEDLSNGQVSPIGADDLRTPKQFEDMLSVASSAAPGATDEGAKEENDSLRPNAPDSDQPPENVPSGSKDDGATGEPQASVMGAGKKPQENEDVAGDGVLPKKHVAPEPNDEGASEQPQEDVPSQPNNDGASGDPQSNGDIIDASDVPAIDYRIVSKTHFSELDRYLAAYLARAPPNSRSTARQKLTRLTIKQVNELSTDVYDELVRRENEKEVPFLPVREEFHPKRNQARQKLATLPVKRWEDLCSDVHWELIRRYPEFKEAPSELQANEDTMGATTTQVTHENMDIAGARDPLTEHVAPWLNDKRASEENVPVTSDDELARDQTPENDILAPDEGSNEQPQEDIIISWKDKDEKQYTVSLPVKQCRSWQTFCARLRTQTMPTLPDMKDMEFVAQAEDSKQFLFEEKWADWLSSYDKLSSPHFVLWFIVDHCLCPESNENEDGVCDTCKVPFLDERSLPSRAQEPLPLLEELPLPEELATSEVTGLAEESTPPAVQKDEKQLDLPASPTSPQPDSQITSFRPSDQNSVLRRRRPAAAQNDEDNDSHNQVVTPSVPATSPVIPSQTTEVAARHGRSTLTDIYIYFIAPPFVRLQTTVWKDRELEVRLENRLNAFQGLVWGANAALSATAVALLALTNISNHPVPQSFLILSLIFSLFGFVFTNFLAIHIGDHRKQFAAWLADPANSDESRSLWNPSIMISLPLTWMCWSFLSLGCCSLALGVQILIFDLQSMNTDHFPGQTTSNNSGNSTKSPPQGTNSSTPSTITLSIFQLAVFALAIVWSSVYVVLIYREIRRCMASQNDRGPVSAEEGRGLLTEDE